MECDDINVSEEFNILDYDIASPNNLFPKFRINFIFKGLYCGK